MKLLMQTLFLTFTILFFNACNAAVFTGYETQNKQKGADLVMKNCDFEDIKFISYTEDENGNKVIKSVDDPIYNSNALAYRMFLCGEFEKSIKLFDIAEDNYKFGVDEKNILVKAAQGTAEILTNENITDYEGQYYERMLNNTYKALNYLALKDYQGARVEINRAIDRQRINKDEFNKDIDKKTKTLEFSKADSDNSNDLIKEHFHFPEIKAYKDFSNPFVSYISALFYVLDQDYSKATYMFKEVATQENNLLYQQDLALAKSNFRLKSSKNKIFKNMEFSKSGKYVWLIFDNGFGKPMQELKLTLPIPIPITKTDSSGNTFSDVFVKTASFAIAKLGDSIGAYEYLNINNKSSVMLSNMDNVLLSEYKATLPYRMLKAVATTTVKTVASFAASNENLYLGLATDIFNVATNRADIRYFVGLPKNYQAARVANTGNITIKTPSDSVVLQENLDINKHYVIYVKSPLPEIFYTQILEEKESDIKRSKK